MARRRMQANAAIETSLEDSQARADADRAVLYGFTDRKGRPDVAGMKRHEAEQARLHAERAALRQAETDHDRVSEGLRGEAAAARAWFPDEADLRDLDRSPLIMLARQWPGMFSYAMARAGVAYAALAETALGAPGRAVTMKWDDTPAGNGDPTEAQMRAAERYGQALAVLSPAERETLNAVVRQGLALGGAGRIVFGRYAKNRDQQRGMVYGALHSGLFKLVALFGIHEPGGGCAPRGFGFTFGERK